MTFHLGLNNLFFHFTQKGQLLVGGHVLLGESVGNIFVFLAGRIY